MQEWYNELNMTMEFSPRRWPVWGRIVFIVTVLALVFVLLNYQYFWANIRFSLFHRQAASINSASNSPSTLSKSGEPVGEANHLEIPSLDIRVPIIYVNEQSEKVYQAALINGVVHFPGTPEPGQYGNVYIFGHSSDYIWSKGHYKTVFAVLPRIKKGAEIDISDTQGHQFVYRVIAQKVVAANDASVLDQGNNQKKLLTLQTSYPVGTALRRYVVVAELAQ
jgi:LPXTG-site transpeptidase (sortase) family protein